jgi:hypothetical protein
VNPTRPRQPDPDPDPERSSRPRRPRTGGRIATVIASAAVLAGACSSGATTDAAPTAPSSTAGAGSSTTLATTAVPESTTTTRPIPPPAPVEPPYDNSVAALACTLLAPEEIQGQFGGPVAPPVPLDPYCAWKIGVDGFVGLTVLPNQPVSRLRSFPGLAAGDVADLGDGAFFAVNKTLYVGMGPTSYVIQFERGAEWVNSNQPKLVALAQVMLDRLGFVPKPKPPPETVPSDPENPDATAPPTSTTTTTRPKPPAVGPAAPVVRPVAPLDPKRVLSPTDPLRIWVGGDSIAGGPAWAVGDAARPLGATVHTEFQVGTGLSRPDFFDWYRHLNAVADAYDPEVMILLFGGNDIQPLQLPFGAGTVSYGDPAWLPEYRRRVAAIMDTLAVRGRQVIWVGTPPMEAPAYNAEMAALNEIYSSEAAARANWVTYFDAWTMFSPAGEPGVFTRTLPDATGQPQNVRFDDIHYDVAGSRLLAAALLDTVRIVSSLPPG